MSIGKYKCRTPGVAITCGIVFCASGIANGANLLMVDFTEPSNPSMVQSGFVAQSNVDHTYNLPNGATALVDLPTTEPGFDQIATRNSVPVLSTGSSFIADGTNIDNMQRDFYVHGMSPDCRVSITFTGLPAGNYHYESWQADSTISGNIVPETYTLSTNGGGSFANMGTIPSDGLPSSPFAFDFVADGTNSVIIRLTEANSYDQVRLNGFALSGALPEPGTLGLLGLGSIALLRRRR